MSHVTRLGGNGDPLPTLLKIVDEIRKETRAFQDRTEVLEGRLNAMEQRAEAMERRAEAMERRADLTEQRLLDREEERGQVAKILAAVVEKVTGHEGRIAHLERRGG